MKYICSQKNRACVRGITCIIDSRLSVTVKMETIANQTVFFCMKKNALLMNTMNVNNRKYKKYE